MKIENQKTQVITHRRGAKSAEKIIFIVYRKRPVNKKTSEI